MADPEHSRNIPYPSHLPIVGRRNLIVNAIRKHRTLVITGETGSGKSTQIPKMCLEAGQGISRIIGVTQPRRVAAITIAAQIARELNQEMGKGVGYKIRFQDRTSPDGYIKVMTDGILLAEIRTDRYLKRYDTIIIDEAHERNLNIDFLLGILKGLVRRRKDLKLIITSATIDAEKFSRAFDNAPIIEVSGRMYPVEVRYQPIGDDLDEEGDVTFIDAAIQAIRDLRRERKFADILIFMPTERDIRETAELLAAQRLDNAVILPLYGRLTAGEQKRIFQRFSQQKIIVATNIAETSLTIPGVKYVIDTGLARISRYNPRSRIQSLPIERISQSSANQRKGRCGRIESGVCIRLYSEDDFNARPVFTPPEILRSNLAEVILRMKSLQLCDIRRFPFVDPPPARSIKDGYAVLKELGALDTDEQLTPMGKRMAQFPMDPRIARMIIEAKKEKALSEVMIIAAALSVRDPRERPSEKEARADQAHAEFKDPRSDFAACLKLWKSYHDALKRFRTQNKMRRFCKERFLSYIRMREWIDIYEEIASILRGLRGYRVNRAPAGYDAVHRSVASGYLSNIAFKKEKNQYVAARNRSVAIFPGSGLFKKGGEWIVAAELVQTSKLFARTAAVIDRAWLEELGGDLCRASYSEPHWEKKRGEVVAYQKKTLFGLPIVEKRKVSYAAIDPDEANRIFIQKALVEGEINRNYPFLQHNHDLINRIQDLEAKTRRRNLLVDEETIFGFYAEQIKGICDIRSFDKFLKDKAQDNFLRIKEEDLLIEEPDSKRLQGFPNHLRISGHNLRLSYQFDPSSEADGVTLVVPQDIVHLVPTRPLEWLVPGLLEEKITALLKGLPKSIRKNFVPVARHAKKIAQEMPRSGEAFYISLERYMRRKYGIRIGRDIWQARGLPPHLQMRFSVVDGQGKEIDSTRDLKGIAKHLHEEKEDPEWELAKEPWEKSDIHSWDFGDLPERINIDSQNTGIPFFAYPGLQAEGASVAIRIFKSQEQADRASRKGIILLYSIHFADELRHTENALFIPKNMEELCRPFGSYKKFNLAMFECLKRNLFDAGDQIIRTRSAFLDRADRLRGRIFEIGEKTNLLIQEVLRQRKAAFDIICRLASRSGRIGDTGQLYQKLADDLNQLLPENFLDLYDLARIEHLPRYLKAIQIRCQRAYANPEKDQLKAEKILPHTARLHEAVQKLENDAPPYRLKPVDDFQWMIEEYRVSLFAQELKTAYRVSSARLNKKWKEVEDALTE